MIVDKELQEINNDLISLPIEPKQKVRVSIGLSDLNKLFETIEGLKGEVTRMDRKWADAVSESVALREEVKRYRTALERISVTFDRFPMLEIARKALGEYS